MKTSNLNLNMVQLIALYTFKFDLLLIRKFFVKFQFLVLKFFLFTNLLIIHFQNQ